MKVDVSGQKLFVFQLFGSIEEPTSHLKAILNERYLFCLTYNIKIFLCYFH